MSSPISCVICGRPAVDILAEDTKGPDGHFPALATLHVLRGPRRGSRLCACRLCIIDAVCNFAGTNAAMTPATPPEEPPPPKRFA